MNTDVNNSSKGATTRLPMIRTGQALMSLRDSGYSLPAALAEVVDNSLEARANIIRVRLDDADTETGRKHVHRIIVTDDGDGMDDDLLQHYLQVGFSTRYMRKDSIGKYGVGAKLAALNFGKRIDVWSRVSDGDSWHHVFFDLTSAMKEEEETGVFGGIGVPTKSALPKDIAMMAPEGSGTIVVWSDIDRLEHGRLAADFNSLLVNLQEELSRIFREFIDGGIRLEVNGTDLLAHDPLFLMQGTWADKILTRTNADKHPDLKRGGIAHFGAKVIGDEVIKVKGFEVRLRVTLYPTEATRKRGAGGDKLSSQLRIPQNEGAISFMRMRREIAYNNVPRIFGSAVVDSDRYIGVEISFDPRMDEMFGVRNVKRGVEPHGELRDAIRDRLKKHIATARKELDERWGEVARKDRDHEGEHADIMEAVKDVDSTMPKGRTPEVPPQQVQMELETLAQDTGRDTPELRSEYVERVRNLPFIIESVDFPGKMFIEVKHLNNQVIIRINTRHRFYKELWAPLHDISARDPATVSGADAVKAARRAVEGLALMVVAYGKAQSMSDSPDEYENLTTYWGQFVDTLMGKIKDVI